MRPAQSEKSSSSGRDALLVQRDRLVHLRIPLGFVPQLETSALADQRHVLVQAGELAQRRRNQNASGAVDLHVRGVADQQPLQIARARVEAGQAHQPLLNGLPIRGGVDEQAQTPSPQ